ncbi:conserved exported hypothetical protein [Gammaproteobacteria bacterium]
MKFTKKYPVLIGTTMSMLIANTMFAADNNTLQPQDTTNYQECLTKVAIQNAGKQVNDACFIYFNQFINGANPLPNSKGITVFIDETHNNFHTKDGRYKPFSLLLENDGYTVTSISPTMGFISTLNANPKAVLVIANPVHSSNNPEINWSDPIINAFPDEEMNVIEKWIKAGGSLMLIADHYPFPGAVDKLAQRFGFFMDNGYNFDPNYNNVFLNALLNSDIAQSIMRQAVTTKDLSPNGGTVIKDGVEKSRTVKDDLVDQVRAVMIMLGARVNSMLFWAGTPPSINDGFAAGDGELLDHPITRGRNASESIPFVTSFTGQSFTYQSVPGNGSITNLMALGKNTYTLNPRSQDAYFGLDQTQSENNLVSEALTNQTVPTYTAVKKDTSDSLQGAALTIGAGKLVVFGEAGMFTAQIAADGKSQMGFNNPTAQYNQQFVLNTIHWLDGATLIDTNKSINPSTNTGLTQMPALLDDVKKVAAEAQAVIDDQKARKNGVINGQESYAQHYKDNYSGGGGCTTIAGSNSKDPILPFLVLIAIGYLFIPRKRQSSQKTDQS